MTDQYEVELMGLLCAASEVKGKTRLQKLSYFLQEAEGVILGLNFRMHHYGPYSANLEAQIQSAEFRGLVRIDEPEEGPILIAITGLGEKAAAGASSTDAVNRLLKRLGRRTPRDLELLGTVHFLAGVTRYEGSEEATERLRRAVMDWKGEKFSEQEIEGTIEELLGLGYLEVEDQA